MKSCVADSKDKKISTDGLRVKIAKFSRQKFSKLASNSHADQAVHNELSSACELSEEKKSVPSSRLTVDGTGDTIVEKNEDVPFAQLSKNDSQSTCSLKSGKLTKDGPCKSSGEQKKTVVSLEQNLGGQLGRKFSVEKKEGVVDNNAVLHRGSAAMKDSMKSEGSTSRSGKTEQSHLRHRSSSDGSGSRQHQHHHARRPHDKSGTEHNGGQLVPPLKIRLEHHGKTTDQQAVSATYSVNSCGSENAVDGSGTDAVSKIGDMATTAHVADKKTEKDAIPDAAVKKDDTHNASEQRRTRTTSSTRPMPVTTKRRLTFEESLIAGTCISITTNLPTETDSVKIPVTTPSAVRNEGVEESARQTSKQTAADSKTTSGLNVPVKKDLNSTKKIKLEDDPHANTTKRPLDEVKVKPRCSHTPTEDSNHAKSLSSTTAVHKESESNPIETKPAAVHPQIKSDNKSEPVSVESKSKCTKSDDSGSVMSKNEVSMKNSLTDESQSQSAKHSSSDRTSRHHRHHHDRHRHSSSGVKPHRMTGSQLDYELRQSRHSSSKHGALIHVETQPNGGASVVHAFEEELAALSPSELSEFVREFFRVVFDEEPAGVPRHVMGIVHNSAAYLPDILEYFASAHPDMVVKRNHLGKSSDVETTTIGDYYQLVRSTYHAGTYRTGPLDHFSIVGTKAEETGGYFPEFLDLLDQNEFLKYVSPWGKISELEHMPRNESNDGPIVWARPGEQVVPTADMPKSPLVKKR